MPRSGALAQAVAILTEAEQQESTSRVDLCISLRVSDVDTSGPVPRYVPSTDEQLLEVGGIWNRRTKRWEDGQSETLHVIRIPRGSQQEPAARYVAEWMRRIAIGPSPKAPHWSEPCVIEYDEPRLPGTPVDPGKPRISVEFRRVWTLLLEGGRRGGKSYLSLVSLALYAVMVPNALVWAVSPTNDETDELEAGLRSMMPSSWYTFRGGGGNRASQFKLQNGSRILLISGHKPRALKRGKVDLVLYNEGQNMSRAGWVQLRGAISDTGGMVIIACNPPDSEIGRWIEDVHEQARAAKIKAIAFHMTGKTNPFCTAESLNDMADENDDLTQRREVDGEFVPIGDVVMHAWSDSASVIDDVPARYIDVTARETKRELGRAAGYIVGMDFQKTPHMVGVIYKLFTDPLGEDPAEVIPVCVDEVVIDDANEDDLVNGLEALPRYKHGAPRDPEDTYHGKEIGSYDPKKGGEQPEPIHCAVVMDASGFWQDGEHSKTKHSDQKLRERHWVYLYKPQRDSDRNPDISERFKTTNSRLKRADERDATGTIKKQGRRRMFVLRHCTRMIKAMRSLPNNPKTGVASTTSEFRHVVDGGTYPVYRFFARPKEKRKAQRYTPLNRFDRSRSL